MRHLLILSGALLALAGCNVNTDGGHSSTVTTVYDRTGDAGKGHLRLVMSNYVMRAALGENPNTAAYVTIRNEGDTPDRLVSATCDCAGMVMLHTASMEEPANGFAIAPGESLSFAPGGNHIMLSGLKTRPAAGSVETVFLRFEKAGAVMVAMPVSDTPQDYKH